MQVPENTTVDTPLAFGEDSHSGARLFNRPILENIDALPILGLTPSQLWLHPAKDSSKLVTIAAGQKAVGMYLLHNNKQSKDKGSGKEPPWTPMNGASTGHHQVDVAPPGFK
ncbi:hypothetical protein PtA15_3A330 [Puccinia triticina]|uniref:Uncharacterized protein n=1 Tax=Puccinia triticina TaxID=208348 RepID=A0ABY7CCP8_9BASI|nr:uncharacterized protein PtA15_3A330 [Puccinia triticina]WAQ82964.1 hypothetical protein PtA15_3A330 [Puccinia triticina]WAR53789.1 hypothetical protein PtB15_3B298 [Puccinia triticina]